RRLVVLGAQLPDRFPGVRSWAYDRRMRPAVVFLAGCGRVASEPLAPTTGDDASGDSIRDIDARPVTGRHWVNRNLSDPGPLTGARMTYDSRRGRILMYGRSDAVQRAPLLPIPP